MEDNQCKKLTEMLKTEFKGKRNHLLEIQHEIDCIINGVLTCKHEDRHQTPLNYAVEIDRLVSLRHKLDNFSSRLKTIQTEGSQEHVHLNAVHEELIALHARRDVNTLNTTKEFQKLIRLVRDLQSASEWNCQLKEEIENKINKAYRRVAKHIASLSGSYCQENDCRDLEKFITQYVNPQKLQRCQKTETQSCLLNDCQVYKHEESMHDHTEGEIVNHVSDNTDCTVALGHCNNVHQVSENTDCTVAFEKCNDVHMVSENIDCTLAFEKCNDVQMVSRETDCTSALGHNFNVHKVSKNTDCTVVLGHCNENQEALNSKCSISLTFPENSGHSNLHTEFCNKTDNTCIHSSDTANIGSQIHASPQTLNLDVIKFADSPHSSPKSSPSKMKSPFNSPRKNLHSPLSSPKSSPLKMKSPFSSPRKNHLHSPFHRTKKSSYSSLENPTKSPKRSPFKDCQNTMDRKRLNFAN